MKTKACALSAAVTLLTSLGIPARTFAQNTPPQTDPKAQAKILDQYGKLPLSFEANQGQTDARVKFLSRGAGYTLFLTSDEAVFSLRGAKTKDGASGVNRLLRPSPAVSTTNAVLRMKLVNANQAAKVTGSDEVPATSNYFIGNDPKEWRTNIPNYTRVRFERVYPGVDVVYYGNQRQLEYDFVVAPGTSPGSIRLKFQGPEEVRVDKKGDLLLGAKGEEMRFQKPQVYQEVNGTRKTVEGHYWMVGANAISFRVADYDRSKPLVIDPVLVYSTYLGGTGDEEAIGIALDSAGNAYVTGDTSSINFPTTSGSFQASASGGLFNDAFVTKLNPALSALVYSTYLGGSDNDIGDGIAVDSTGCAYVTGYTASTNFPTTPGAFGSTGGVFVAKLNAAGSALVYSTRLGGGSSDNGRSIAVDSAGNAYLTGVATTANFPTTPGAFQTTFGGNSDAFVVKLNSAGSALLYSTYLGGSDEDIGHGIVVDSVGNAYVTGNARSTDFPTTPGVFQPAFSGTNVDDAFVAKFNSAGSMVYSTFLGSSGEEDGQAALGIAVDSAGNVYVTGETFSTNFPTTPGAFQTALAGNGDVYVAKLNSTGSELIYSTYLGGSDEDVGFGIFVDSVGNAYVTGYTVSANFPTTPNAFQAVSGGGTGDAFVAEFDPTGSALIYSTYLGGSGDDIGFGIAVDSVGNAYLTGRTYSANFPVTANAYQTAFGGGLTDAFVTKIASHAPRYSVCLLYDPTKPVHSGATIPIKLLLCDGSGNDLSSSSITVHAISISQISISTSGAVENSGDSNPHNDFRFDATLGSTGGYIFNLKTTGLSTGTYSVNFTVTCDSFVYAADFQVK